MKELAFHIINTFYEVSSQYEQTIDVWPFVLEHDLLTVAKFSCPLLVTYVVSRCGSRTEDLPSGL